MLAKLPCQVALVRMQVNSALPQGRDEAFPRSFLEALRAETERRGFTLHDLNEAPFPRAAEDFHDRTHLGAPAAELNSRLFAREALVPRLRAKRLR